MIQVIQFVLYYCYYNDNIIHVESETVVALRCLSYFLIPKTRKKVKENSHTVIPNLLMEGTVSKILLSI